MRHEVEQSLRLVSGKFMRGDKEEAPEIGNAEQIALLRQAEREAAEREKNAKAGKLDVDIYVKDIEYEVICEFKCVCGHEIKERDRNSTYDWEDLEDPEYEGGTITCEKCGREYEIDGQNAKLV